MNLTDCELQIMEMDERLRPLANRPVDITVPGWVDGLKHAPSPLDEAGIRERAENFLTAITAEYMKCGEAERQAIRRLFGKYRAFSWAATFSFPPGTDERFRLHLVLFSIKDQGRDSRDAVLELQHFCATAKASRVNTAPILKEVAELSSDKDKYGMGSTRSLLLTASRE